MKINNKRVNFTINIIYVLTLGLIVVSLFSMYFNIKAPSPIPPVYEHWMGVVAGIVIFFVLKRRGHQHFEYDSDGEVLNFFTQNVFYNGRIGSHKKNAEFPKKKLLSYKVKKTLLKKELLLSITSKEKGKKLLKFDIAYLNKTESNSLKKSLKKVLEANKLRIHG